MIEVLYLTVYSLPTVFHSSSPQVKVLTNCTIHMLGITISTLPTTSVGVLIASWLMSTVPQKSHFRIFFFQTIPYANYLRSMILGNRCWDEEFAYRNFTENAIRNNTYEGLRMQAWAKWWIKLQSGYCKVFNWSIVALELRQHFRLPIAARGPDLIGYLCGRGVTSGGNSLWAESGYQVGT